MGGGENREVIVCKSEATLSGGVEAGGKRERRKGEIGMVDLEKKRKEEKQ